MTSFEDRATMGLSSPEVPVSRAGGEALMPAVGGERAAKVQPATRRMVPPLASIIPQIQELAARRRFVIDSQRRLDNAVGAYARRLAGWSRDLPPAEQAKARDRAADLVKVLAAGKPSDDPAASAMLPLVAANEAARAPFDTMRRECERDMVRLAKALPVAAWVEGVRGFGLQGLALIVGEAGDIGTYANPGKLWKRMGMAPISKDGATHSGAWWRGHGGLGKDDWTAAGYSTRRRSQMWQIGDPLIKHAGPFREVYDARKAYLIEREAAKGRTCAPSAKIPKGREAEFVSQGEIHNQAKHYMEKRLLRELWRAWRAASCAKAPKVDLPPANPSAEDC